MFDEVLPALGDQFVVNLDDRSIDVLNEMGSQITRQPLPRSRSMPPQYRRQCRNIADRK